MKINQTVSLSVLITLILVGLVGYGLYTKRGDEGAGVANLVVRVADLPVVHALPFYVALEKGYFKEAGIAVERVRIDAPNLIIDALLSGQVDLTSPSGALGITGVASSKNPGKLKIYMVSGGNLDVANDALLVRNDSSVSSFDDLTGKRLGILPGIQWRTISRHILAQHGLEADKDVQIVELAPGLQAPALGSGQIDALLGIEPMPTIVKARGIGKEIVHAPTAQAIANPFYPGAGVIRAEFAKEQPELTEKIMQVFERALQEIRNNPDGVKQYYKGYTPLEDDLIPKAPVLQFKLYRELNEADISAIQRFYDIFTQHGVVEGKIDAHSLLYGQG